jgi:hypothetical protein
MTGTDKMTGPAGDTKIGAEEIAHQPHWYSNGKRIREGVLVTAKTSMAPVITTSDGRIVSSCKVADSETVVNPGGGGAGGDEVSAFNITCGKISPACPAGTKLHVQALGLPWTSQLVAGSPIDDEIRNMAIAVECVGGLSVVYQGTLLPRVLSSTALDFSAGSGTLSGNNSTTATISGFDKLTGPVGDTKITALDP